jgi:hypothetical protein
VNLRPLDQFVWHNVIARPAFEVRCKTGVAIARNGSYVHNVERLAAIRGGGRLRFAARWLCGNGSTDVIVLGDAYMHGLPCDRCADQSLGPIVYRCRGIDGVLLYVGSTGNGPASRLRVHEKNAHWWTQVADVHLEHFQTLPLARIAEAIAIRTEHPLHNKSGRARRLAVAS